MRLLIPAHCEHSVRTLARQSYPHECCGFLIGTADGEDRCVRQVEAALNENSTSPRNRFLITPEALRLLEGTLQGSPNLLLGFFHSHPDHPARPSHFDLEHAWPWYSYVIVSASAEGTGDLTSWRLRDDRSGFRQEIVVGAENCRR